MSNLPTFSCVSPPPFPFDLNMANRNYNLAVTGTAGTGMTVCAEIMVCNNQDPGGMLWIIETETPLRSEARGE
ncbi:hypothetical protein RDT67_18830 [Serratia fonticola]|uniref:Uncharacterized protein n=1 Tax=Serratia fonticola TaxID=47917 RepID=A0AAJ1YDP5_SERFO|nr:hypothetical protein [Serratia fonticola]MDQ9128475.1 hypothetical protein [Serratia fonticola]